MLSYAHAFSPVVSFMINVVLQVAIFRYRGNFGLLKSEFAAFFLGFSSLLLIEFHYITQTCLPKTAAFSSVLVNLITYLALGYCYFHFINLGETARRIRILRELHDSKAALSMQEILKRYPPSEIVEKRIERLINNGQIVLKDGRYFIGSPLVLLMARIILAARFIILGKRSGLE